MVGFVRRVVYWLVVLAISLVLLVVLVRFFESRDEANLDGAALPAPALVA